MTDDLKLASKLLGDFQASLEKRSAFFLVYNVLPVVLEWHFKSWQKEMEFLDPIDESKRDIWSEYYQLVTICVGIFDNINKKVLLERGNNLYGFFDKLKKHVEKYKDEKVIIKNIQRYYAEEILSNFYRSFFKEIENSQSNYTIWEQFPSEWKITLTGIKESIVQKITLNEFIKLAKEKLWSNSTNKYDRALDDLEENLFPEVSPQTWADILVFVLGSWMNDDRMKSLVERSLIFGVSSRPQVFWGGMTDAEMSNKMSESEDEQAGNAIDLALILFKNQFTSQGVSRDLEQLGKLSYPDDSREELRKVYLIKLWENIKIHLEKLQ